MAERMGVSRQAIAQQLNKLVEYGYVEKKARKRENGSNTSCLYRIIFEDNTLELPDFEEPDVVVVHPAENKKPKVEGINLFSFAKTLASVCQLDFNLNKSRLFKEAKDLYAAGYTENNILAIYGNDGPWYTDDFRGKKGDLPNLAFIRITIGKLMNVDPAPIVSGDVSKGYYD
jgi:hypothetical protein